MYSGLVPFQRIIDAVKSGIGVTNLRNLYPEIRRLVHRAQGEIGYGGSLLMKKVEFSVEDGTIQVDSFGNRKIRLPEDLVRLEDVGSCHDGLCPDDYKHQGNYLFLCKPIEKTSLIYYSFICDGEGNPTVSNNHFEAVVAGVKFFLYEPKLWNNEGNMSFFKHLEKYYEDRIGEARGDDVFPTTKKEWANIASMLRMSQRDLLIYNNEKSCYCCLPSEKQENPYPGPGPTPVEPLVYYWQFDGIQDNISFAPTIDQSYLDGQPSSPLSVFSNGNIVSYTKIGRIAFAITNANDGQYGFEDVFETDITNIVFNTYYNSELQAQIFISKEYYVLGNIYFKIINQ